MEARRIGASPSEEEKTAETQNPVAVLARIASVFTDRRLTSDEKVILIGMLVHLACGKRDDYLIGHTWHKADIRFASKTLGWSPQRLRLAWRSLEAKGFIRIEKGQVADVRLHVIPSAFA